MMKYMTTLEKNMPAFTSQAAYRSSSSVAPRRCQSRRRPRETSSSTSWLACQTNRYGEMVVPRRATSRARNGAVQAEGRQEGPPEHRAPVGPGEEGGGDVSEQGQRQPLEGVGDQPVRAPHLEGEDQQPDRADQ